MLTAKMLYLGMLVALSLSTGDQELDAIRLNVNLVQLHARVNDSAGHAVSGLGKEAFALYVDDVPQPITSFRGEDEPVTAGIVIDNSASMASKREEVIAAALAFARASNENDQMFVVHFSGHPRLGLPQGVNFTGDITELESAIAAFELGGTTAYYDAVMLAESQLRKGAYPRKVLLTITDGGDNSSQATLAGVLDGALKAGIVVYSIGIFDAHDYDRNPQVLSKIAEKTGGEAFFPEQLGDVTRTCVGIAQDIREQYALGFPGAEDGKYHPIRLTAAGAKNGTLTVHTRSGYVAAKPSEPVAAK
ncbi:MAG: VWA domain-containing protein [Bryobacteraceae bacterium]